MFFQPFKSNCNLRQKRFLSQVQLITLIIKWGFLHLQNKIVYAWIKQEGQNNLVKLQSSS